MSGKSLNPVLLDIFKQGVSARDSDIRNVIRYGHCKKGYNAANKVQILEEDLKEVPEEKTIQILKTEIRIMLEIVEDAELQVTLTQIYNENKSRGLDFLSFFWQQATTIVFLAGNQLKIDPSLLILLRYLVRGN